MEGYQLGSTFVSLRDERVIQIQRSGIQPYKQRLNIRLRDHMEGCVDAFSTTGKIGGPADGW